MKQFWGVWSMRVDGTGWKSKRLEKGVERSLRWPCVPPGDCVGALAASFGAAPGAGSPM